MTKSWQPAILGGLLIGVLSSLPIVNLCCCLWVVGGGIMTAYLLQQRSVEPIETADAVLSGLVAGLIGGILMVVLSALITPAGLVEERMRMAIDQNPGVPPEMRDMMLRFASGNNVLLIMAAVTVPIYGVVSLLGALIGVALFRKKSAPPAQQG